MSLGELYDDLDEYLTGDVDALQEQAPERFAVTDLATADWAVRKIARARRRFADAKLLADAQLERTREWIAAEQHRLDTDTAYLTGLLEAFHRRTLDEDPKAKTIRLPSGTLVARKQPDVVDVTDVDAFVAWASDGHNDLLRTKVEPDKTAIKNTLGAAETGLVHVPDTGELVPGLTWRDGDVKFSVDTEVSS